MRSILHSSVFMALCAVTVLAGCRENEHDTVPVIDTKMPSEPIVKQKKESPVVDSRLQSIVDKAKRNLARELSVDESTVQLIAANYVNWRSSALGCPQPGMGYLQVITPGILIRLRSSGVDYRYHGTRNAEPFLCAAPGTAEEPARENGGSSHQIDDGT